MAEHNIVDAEVRDFFYGFEVSVAATEPYHKVNANNAKKWGG